MRILITGANGYLARRIMSVLSLQHDIIAAVRSESAAMQLRSTGFPMTVKVIDYTKASDLAQVGEGCDVIIHLVGIIKESATNSFEDAHEKTCEALVSAKLCATSIIYLGIIGTEANSNNTCFKSRYRAEKILQNGVIATTVLRIPMVIGEDTYAISALKKKATSWLTFTFRAGSLEQPIDSSDVVAGIVKALELSPENRVIELAGPVSLPRRVLIEKIAQRLNHDPIVISIPLSLGYVIAALLKLIVRNPPVTPAMLGVLDHDDNIDVTDALALLGLSLTPLDETLSRLVKSDQETVV